jgi:hypothetical protein
VFRKRPQMSAEARDGMKETGHGSKSAAVDEHDPFTNDVMVFHAQNADARVSTFAKVVHDCALGFDATGSTVSIVVPSPGFVRIRRCPPTCSALARMHFNP